METKERRSRGDDLGFRAASMARKSLRMKDLTARATVVKRIVPKNMADAMVVNGAVSDAE